MMKYFLSCFVFFFLISIHSMAQADTQVYFSPNGGCQEAVIKEINKSRDSMDIAMFSITSREIAQAIIKAKERGVKVRVILDKSQIKEHFSKGRLLINQGVDVKFLLGPGLMHDKFAIIDGRGLLTGSFNWTVSADKRNAENLLVLTDKEIAQKYTKDFRKLWGQSGQGEFNEKSTAKD